MLKKSRLNAVLGRMEKMGLEQMVITDAISILYLTGVWVDACERLVALYINKNGGNRFFVNNMFHVPKNVGVHMVRFTDTDPYRPHKASGRGQEYSCKISASADGNGSGNLLC